MMDFGLSEERLHAIRSILLKYPQVSRALIFGSRARGDFKHHSDIDLAIYAVDKKTLAPALFIDLDEAAGIYKTNIINMNDLENETLREQIIEQGYEIYSIR
ncbi:MAG: nucleotidyltransferase domain-containing protein [Syntrophomonas sp.]